MCIRDRPWDIAQRTLPIAMTDTIPAGFAPWLPSSQFMRHLADLGGFYRREADDVLACLLYTSQRCMWVLLRCLSRLARMRS